MSSVVRARDLVQAYEVRRGFLRASVKLQAVRGVSLEIAPGKTLAVVGESGSGKSTLGRMIGLIEKPISGELELDGVGPDDLNIERLLARIGPGQELILALNATVEGQTTAHYLADRMAGKGIRISRLAQGVPIGGELDYLDDGTLTAALKARREL